MIIGHENATSVTVTIPTGSSHSVTVDGTSHTGSFTFSLNKLQTFHLGQTKATSAEATISQYKIVADKPVSVISGNAVPHRVSQLAPVTKYGKKYVLIPAYPASDSRTTTYILQAVETGKTRKHILKIKA